MFPARFGLSAVSFGQIVCMPFFARKRAIVSVTDLYHVVYELNMGGWGFLKIHTTLGVACRIERPSLGEKNASSQRDSNQPLRLLIENGAHIFFRCKKPMTINCVVLDAENEESSCTRVNENLFDLRPGSQYSVAEVGREKK